MKKAMKRLGRDEVGLLEDIPNIGKAIAADLRLLGIGQPHQLVGQDPLKMYERLCKLTQAHHDPCVLDTFMSAVRFMEGAPALPWWAYTAERKSLMSTKNRA